MQEHARKMQIGYKFDANNNKNNIGPTCTTSQAMQVYNLKLYVKCCEWGDLERL